MTHPALRAFVFALFALCTWAIVGAIASVAVVGLPQSAEAIPAWQQRIASEAVTVSLVVAVFVLLLFGWLAARRYAGRDAVLTGFLLGLFYVVIEIAIEYVLAGTDRLNVAGSAVVFGIKLAAATAGGLLASRSPASDEAAPRNEP
jgi:cytochrome b561